MKPGNQVKNLFKGTVILTIAALCTKILSAFYRIPFQNIVGDIGFYIYQQVYPFYGIAIVLSTYGFPVVISKLHAEEMAKGEQGNTKQLFVVSMLFLLGFGLLCFLLLYSGAGWLANYMNDPQLIPLLKVIAVIFLIMPVIALLRGFFQGSDEMMPTAVSQVSEQLVRVLTILVSALFLVYHHYSLYSVGIGAVFGSITGGVTSALILLFFWQRIRKKEPLHGAVYFRQSGRIIKTFFLQAFPFCVSSMLLIFIQLADSLNLYSLLIDSGLGSEVAKSLKGIYDRGQPLIQLGTVVATSMSLSLVPLITKEKLQKDTSILTEKIQLALKISILVGVGATMGLWNIIKPTNMMLFENTDGSHILAVLSLSILLASIIMTVTAILQGLGSIFFPAVAIFGCFVMKYVLNILLIPKFGTMGAALASIFSLLVILVMLVVKLHKMMEESLIHKRFYVMISVAAVVMMVVLNVFLQMTDFFYEFGHSKRLFASMQALGAVILGGFAYMVIILKTNLFKEDELSLLPLGSKLMVFLPKKNGR
ncbi:oligosaccharide flippase family protein [Bacillus sp. V3B]|uniref:putative polysaccharide biosynthesis protein n=1 Tax=Bacillus sp. V3B TaxID=2804915 RepID=UPI00210C0184|nr:oligosaccharide flippase family protein [Bacillus sp. V3B]MCQ6276724.1 oligosaccharide flippase family protein [Bacillus sp. V3B]